MRLRSIELPGFGCLRDFRAEFAPGLNLAYGLNEAGKSTLQQAICALLYGFYDNDRVRQEESQRHERLRPWPRGGSALAGPYRGTLEYELENGNSYEVRRDFSTSDVATQLIDLATGVDVAPSFGLGRHGNVPFARRQLGMSRAVFQRCALIAQGEIFEVSNAASPREIGDAIAAMADSGRRDVSAAGALARLDALVRRIGRDSARTAELPKARENLRRAEAELAALKTARATMAERAGQLQAAQARLLELGEETARLQVLSLQATISTVKRRLDALAETEAEISRAGAEAASLEQYSGFPAQLRDRVVALADRWERLSLEVVDCEGIVLRAHGAVDDGARLDYEALRTSAGALSPAAISELETAAYTPVEPVTVTGPSLIARLASVVARIVSGVLDALFRRRARAPAPVAEAAPAPRIAREEASAILERYRRYLELRPAIEAADSAEAHLRDARSALEGAERQLVALLEAGPEADIVSLKQAFLDGCDGRSRYEAAAAAAGEAHRRREAILDGRSGRQLEVEFHESEASLAALLAEKPDLEGCRSSDSAEVVTRRLEALSRERHELELRMARLDEELSATLRDHRSGAEIEEDVERWKREAARLERARSAALIAEEVIGEAMAAVYRDFAPAVSSFLSDGVERVTEGRYRRAHVDPSTLQVSLLLPETGQVITDPPVSRGTRALAYVLMRIGLAQHMSAVGEPVPLVLDDPFVDFDSKRVVLMLDFIAELSQRMQVLLFSKDPGVLRWFEAQAGGGRHSALMLSRESAVPSL